MYYGSGVRGECKVYVGSEKVKRRAFEMQRDIEKQRKEMKCNCNCKYRCQERRSQILEVKLTRHMLQREKDLCMSWLDAQPGPQSDAASDDAADCPAQHHQHPQDWRSTAGVCGPPPAVTGSPQSASRIILVCV